MPIKYICIGSYTSMYISKYMYILYIFISYTLYNALYTHWHLVVENQHSSPLFAFTLTLLPQLTTILTQLV